MKAVFAALAFFVRTSLGDRGNIALELGGGAHMKVVKAHQAQELSKIKDELRELQERVHRLEALLAGMRQEILNEVKAGLTEEMTPGKAGLAAAAEAGSAVIDEVDGDLVEVPCTGAGQPPPPAQQFLDSLSAM